MSKTQSQMEKNVVLYFIANFFRNLWISMPVSILYFQDRGITFIEIGILEAVVSGVIFLTDIPSGAFADIFGRKFSTGLGLFLWGVSLVLIGVFSSFKWYILTMILMGLGDSFISGASKALFYDTLKQMKKEHLYLKYVGNGDMISAVAVILSSILGAFFYEINISLPYIAHGIACLIAGVIIFMMKEPVKSAKVKSLKSQYNLILKSLSFVWKSKIIRFITLFWILILTLPMIFVNIIEQPYLYEIGIPVIFFGVIFGLTRGVIGFFAPLRYKIEKKIGEKGSFYGITIIFGVMFLLMAINIHPSSVGFLFLLFFTRDYTWSILDKYANDHIQTDKRATVLSIINFGLNLFYMLIIILVGYALDTLNVFGQNSIVIIVFILGLACFMVVLPFLGYNYKNLGRNLGRNLDKK